MYIEDVIKEVRKINGIEQIEYFSFGKYWSFVFRINNKRYGFSFDKDGDQISDDNFKNFLFNIKKIINNGKN